MDTCYEMAASIPVWWALLILIPAVIGSYTLGWVQAKKDDK